MLQQTHTAIIRRIIPRKSGFTGGVEIGQVLENVFPAVYGIVPSSWFGQLNFSSELYKTFVNAYLQNVYILVWGNQTYAKHKQKIKPRYKKYHN